MFPSLSTKRTSNSTVSPATRATSYQSSSPTQLCAGSVVGGLSTVAVPWVSFSSSVSSTQVPPPPPGVIVVSRKYPLPGKTPRSATRSMKT